MKSKYEIEQGSLLDFPYNKYTMWIAFYCVFAGNKLCFQMCLGGQGNGFR